MTHPNDDARADETGAGGTEPPASQSQPVDPYAGTEIGTPAVPDQPYPGQPYAGQAYPNQPYDSQPYPGQPYPGQSYDSQPYPGPPYPGQPYAAQAYPGGAYPPASTPMTRPGSVLAAAIILLVFGGLGLLGTLASRFAGTITINGDTAYIAGTIVGTIISLAVCAAALGGGAWLLKDRSNNARILATVAAVVLLFTCVGIVATIAVPILLWATESSKAWFTPGPTDTGPAPF